MEDEKEEIEQNLEFAEEKQRKALSQVDQLQSELSMERSASQKSENAKAQLERQNKELKIKLSEMEQMVKTKQKNAIASMESKIANLEDQLEAECKYVQLGILSVVQRKTRSIVLYNTHSNIARFQHIFLLGLIHLLFCPGLSSTYNI